jgi:hypothetical protein
MNETSTSISKGAVWTGRILSGVPVLLLVMSAIMKFMKPPPVMQGMGHLGFSENLLIPLGIVELLCVVIYLVPRTAVLGAILITGYLGGATAASIRVGEPYYAPALAGVLAWGGLYLRDIRLKKLIPFCV